MRHADASPLMGGGKPIGEADDVKKNKTKSDRNSVKKSAMTRQYAAGSMARRETLDAVNKTTTPALDVP